MVLVAIRPKAPCLANEVEGAAEEMGDEVGVATSTFNVQGGFNQSR